MLVVGLQLKVRRTLLSEAQLDLWRFGLVGNVVGRINEVNRRRARLVLGWVTVFKNG